MLNRADELAARDSYHRHATWRRIIAAVGQLVNKTLPGVLYPIPLPARWFHS
jgi:hypothetical protein